MNATLKDQKNEILKQLAGSVEQYRAAGIGELIEDLKSLTLIDIDLSDFPFLGENARAYANDKEQYMIASAKNELIYIGHIDSNAPVSTVLSDLEEFPHLIEVSILTGQGELEKIENLFNSPVYFISYLSEFMYGLVKAHNNGHLVLKEELEKSLS